MKINVLNQSLIISLILVLSSCNNKELNIVDDGVSNYEIVTADNVSDEVHFAATELQNYIQKISSVKIPIVQIKNQDKKKQIIFVQIEKINKNEIVIKTRGKNLVIGGGSDDAVRNAVYEFLEKFLNCRWYTPSVEEIPISKSIVLNNKIDYSYTPSIIIRTVHSRLFYNNKRFAEKHKVTTEAFPFYVPIARVHTFNKFVPEEKYFKKYPEYYALRNGVRLPTQLCLTNPEVYRIVKDSVASFFNQYPSTKVISVSQNDNQQYCEDKNCKIIDKEEGSHAGSLIRFVNKIATNFPDKIISTLAYQYTRKPPKTHPAKNVMITLCSIECDRSAPIEDKCTDFADDLKGWRKITNNIRIWDYTTQFTNFLAPFPNIHTLQPNIQFFKNNNAKWVFEQHSNNPSELFELRSYIMAELLWNPDRNINNLISEFTNGYYQEAGIYVKKYVDLIEKKIQEDKRFPLFLYGDPSQAFTSYLNPKLLNTYSNIFDKAEKAVKNKPEVIERVKEARLGIDYAILEACRKNLTKKFSMVKVGNNGVKLINRAVVRRLDNFYNTCNKANINLMNEMGFTVKEYYTNYKKAIEVATQPNKAFGKKVILLTKPKKYANEDPQTLTDGALGGNSFYANWLGFEGNNLDAIIDLESKQPISSIVTAFLQVTNHIVFFPIKVTYYYSNDNKNFIKLGVINNDEPLNKTSKVNEIKYFNLSFSKVNARYIKIVGENMKEAPYWHHGAGLPAWIFADEVIVN